MQNDLIRQIDNFAALFNNVQGELIKWNGPDYVGISFLIEYPKGGAFIPIITKDGKADSVAVVKIGYEYKSNLGKDKIILTVKALKASRYLFNKHFYNFEDINSPTKESVELSKKSKQPIDLEELSRYEYRPNENKIFDLSKRKYVNPKKIADEIYAVHLKTLDDKVFQFKMALQNIMVELINPINESLKIINFYMFGKTIKKKNSMSGFFSPYSDEEFVDSTVTSEKPKILGTDFPISYQSATTFILLIFLIFIIKYKWGYDVLGFANLIDTAGKNSLFMASLISVSILMIDRVIPLLIFMLINSLIRLKFYLITLKISIEDSKKTSLI